MKRKSRTDSEFKSKVALAAIKGGLTMADLVKKLDGHVNQISEEETAIERNAGRVR